MDCWFSYFWCRVYILDTNPLLYHFLFCKRSSWFLYEVPESRKVTGSIYLAFSSSSRVITNSSSLRNSPLNPKLDRRRINIFKLQQGILKSHRTPCFFIWSILLDYSIWSCCSWNPTVHFVFAFSPFLPFSFPLPCSSGTKPPHKSFNLEVLPQTIILYRTGPIQLESRFVGKKYGFAAIDNIIMQSYALAGIGLPCGGLCAFLLTFMCLKTLWCSQESGAFSGVLSKEQLRETGRGHGL